MPRRRRAIKREIEPDPKFNSPLVAKFINCLMKDGKKSIAEKIFYEALNIIEKKNSEAPSLELFKKAVELAKPVLEVRSRRVGGATYQVPTEVRSERRQSLAFRWIINFARARSGKSMAEKLAAEILDILAGQGATVKKREDTHRMAEANKAFAHYRW